MKHNIETKNTNYNIYTNNAIIYGHNLHRINCLVITLGIRHED